MKKLATFIQKWGAVLIAPVAIALAAETASTACAIWFHQPEMPKGMEKFKKQR